MERMVPQLTLVLGGAASGKSAWAERLAEAVHPVRVYLATAEPRDREMAAKIDRHRARRGSGWSTIEAGGELIAALAEVPPGRVVLADCATLWLSALLETRRPAAPAFAQLAEACARCAAPVILVSNELGQGLVPGTGPARRFRQLHGEMNQSLAARAGLVVAVMAGLPLTLKGRLPEEISGAPGEEFGEGSA